jgi:hypothetical protein
MKNLAIFCSLAAASSLALGESKPTTFATLELNGAAPLKNVTVLKVEPDGIRVEHEEGVAKVKFENLSEAVQKQFGFDTNKATEFREAKVAEAQVRRAAERAEALDAESKALRRQQDEDVAQGRKDFFALLKSENYDYAELDAALRDSVKLLKEAGRDDLAQVLEEDRAYLKDREAKRPTAAQLAERAQLLNRIQQLESQVAGLSRQPTHTTTIIEDRASCSYPIYINRPVIVRLPEPIVSPCPTPRPIIRPRPCPTPSPILTPQPLPPYMPTPIIVHNPYRTSSPSVPRMGTPVTQPQFGPTQANGYNGGAHIWNRPTRR